jgi:DNA-binding NtrC family response regulator
MANTVNKTSCTQEATHPMSNTSNPLRKRLVLIIDDEDIVREAVCDILELAEIDVLTAENGQAGVELYAQRQHDIGLIILDMRMPGLDGSATYDLLRQINPSVRVIFSSGYSETDLSQAHFDTPSVSFLQKPYNMQKLIATVVNALEDS